MVLSFHVGSFIQLISYLSVLWGTEDQSYVHTNHATMSHTVHPTYSKDAFVLEILKEIRQVMEVILCLCGVISIKCIKVLLCVLDKHYIRLCDVFIICVALLITAGSELLFAQKMNSVAGVRSLLRVEISCNLRWTK